MKKIYLKDLQEKLKLNTLIDVIKYLLKENIHIYAFLPKALPLDWVVKEKKALKNVFNSLTRLAKLKNLDFVYNDIEVLIPRNILNRIISSNSDFLPDGEYLYLAKNKINIYYPKGMRLFPEVEINSLYINEQEFEKILKGYIIINQSLNTIRIGKIEKILPERAIKLLKEMCLQNIKIINKENMLKIANISKDNYVDRIPKDIFFNKDQIFDEIFKRGDKNSEYILSKKLILF